MSIEPHVAILLLNWNGWQDTLECLNSIFRLDYDNFTVVLCDNDSSDDSVDRFRDWAKNPKATDSPTHRRKGQTFNRELPPMVSMAELTRVEAEAGMATAPAARVILVHNGGNLGFAEGNNVGLRYAMARPGFDYVWILNNDVVVDSHALSELVRCARSEPDVGGVGSTIFEYSEPYIVQAAGGGVFSPQNIIPRLITRPRRNRGRSTDAAPLLDFISGACMLVGVDELQRAGLIDEAFFIYCEDVDLGVRIRAGGKRLLHARESKIWHKGGSTVGHRSLRHDYYTVRNMLALTRKHYPLLVPLVGSYLIYRAVLPKIARRQWKRIGAAWRGYRDYRDRVAGPVPL